MPFGRLVFLRKGTLMAVRFDQSKLEIIGQPVSVVAVGHRRDVYKRLGELLSLAEKRK